MLLPRDVGHWLISTQSALFVHWTTLNRQDRHNRPVRVQRKIQFNSRLLEIRVSK